MTMKYQPTVTLERWQVETILTNMGLDKHATTFWREAQKTAAKKPVTKKTTLKRARKAA